MRKKDYPANLRSDLIAVVSRRLDELLVDANIDASVFGDLRRNFHKLDLLVVVTYTPWSKWPWLRTPVPFSADLYEPAQRLRIIDIVAPQLVDLMLRDMPASLDAILCHMRKEHLMAALKRFYVNEFTGVAVGRLMLQMAVEQTMNERGVLTAEEMTRLIVI